ncbi:aminoacyl transferase sphA [Aspergillus stella-maris]|uniref:aminoacyl transferase sphA n=1 Tax=Aspergillus stella-maris TaxID=1810926 RepID=UPI003CCE445B
MSSSPLFTRWLANQKPRAQTLLTAPIFYRNLEEALDVRRKDHGVYSLLKNTWSNGTTIDICTNDSLSFGSSGRLRAAFEAELALNPDAALGAGGSRLMDGNYDYIEAVEQEIADYHGVEAALILGSGCDANYAIFEAIPRSGDVIVYDELVHASIIDGMARSLASVRLPFAHNDVDAFREVLLSIWDEQPLVKQGGRCVLIVVESVYSMDGDMAPLRDLIQVAKEVFPAGNAQFIVDEAHSMGVLGERGLGYAEALGLSEEIAIKTHTFSKSFGSIGGVVLGNQTVKNALLNFSRSTVFTAAPCFNQIAAIRAGYALMPQPESDAGRANIQHLVKRLFARITAHPIWEEANERGIILIPVSEDWEEREMQSQLVMLWTRERYGQWLSFHLDARKYSAFPVMFPVVPKGSARLRVVIHADHTEELIDGFVDAVCEWAEEMVRIERGATAGVKIPWAAQQVYALEEVQ